MGGTRRGDVEHRGAVAFLPTVADSDPDRLEPQSGLVSCTFGISPADRQLFVGAAHTFPLGGEHLWKQAGQPR